MENDPLNYSALLDENGNWKEWATSMFIAPPEDSYLAYGSAKFRKKSAKNVTLQQIQKRFKQVKDFVTQNADKLHQVKFDIGEKIGTAVNEAVLGRQKPLQKTLIVYPNATFDRSQAKQLPIGTSVEMAQGGDNYQGNTAKIVASVNGEASTWFTWNDQYYEAISPPRNNISTT